MAVSVVVDNALLASLAEKITQARKLYGADSPYVIGLFAGFDWLLAGSEGAESARRQLCDRVVEHESGRPSKAAAEPATPGGDALVENSWIKGKVKWFNNDKGYGFISTDGSTDVFVHWRDISSWDRSLTQGDEVEFMVTKTAKGFQAINVMKASKDTRVGEEASSANGDSAAAPAAAVQESQAPSAEAPAAVSDDSASGSEN